MVLWSTPTIAFGLANGVELNSPASTSKEIYSKRFACQLRTSQKLPLAVRTWTSFTSPQEKRVYRKKNLPLNLKPEVSLRSKALAGAFPRLGSKECLFESIATRQSHRQFGNPSRLFIYLFVMLALNCRPGYNGAIARASCG